MQVNINTRGRGAVKTWIPIGSESAKLMQRSRGFLITATKFYIFDSILSMLLTLKIIFTYLYRLLSRLNLPSPSISTFKHKESRLLSGTTNNTQAIVNSIVKYKVTHKPEIWSHGAFLFNAYHRFLTWLNWQKLVRLPAIIPFFLRIRL